MGDKIALADFLEQLLDETEKEISKIKVKKPPARVVKTYEYQKSMLYAIQAATGEQTHEILANLTTEADDHLKASGIDLTLTARENARINNGYRGYERRVHKYIYYPGTKIHLGIYVTYTSPDYQYRGKFDSQLKYSFKLPTSALKLTQEEYDEYIADGILCDASKQVEEPQNRDTLTAEEREVKEKLRKEKMKAYAKKKTTYRAGGQNNNTSTWKSKKKKVPKRKKKRRY